MNTLPSRPPSVNPNLIPLKEASRLSGIKRDGLILLMKTGHLPYLRVGLAVYIRRDDVTRISERK